MTEKVLNLDQQLCFSAYRVNRLFSQFYELALAPFELTYPQYLVLVALWEQDHQAVHELGDHLHLASNTLTPLLKRLETAGWLTRIRPASNQRQLVISLTPKAISTQSEVATAIATCIDSKDQDIHADYERLLADNHHLIKTLQRIIDERKSQA